MPSKPHKSIRLARVLMDRRYDTPITIDDLSREVALSPYYLIRAFKHVYKQTPHQYLISLRIARAKELLRRTDLSVTDICAEVGFESLGSFSTLFHKAVGWSPSIYRARAWEMHKNPLKFIPNCYVIMQGIQVSDPKE